MENVKRVALIYLDEDTVLKLLLLIDEEYQLYSYINGIHTQK